MSTTGISQNYFSILKNKKTDFRDNFVLFGTPFGPYLLNRLSYRSETLTQNGRRWALKKCQPQESRKIIFLFLKNKKN